MASSDNLDVPPVATSSTSVVESMLVYGMMSVAGRSREMKDVISIQTYAIQKLMDSERCISSVCSMDTEGVT